MSIACSGAFADGGVDLADFDLRQQRRFFVQIIRHRRQARRDDAADVIPARIDDVKRDRRAKIHHHHRRAKAFARRHRVRQPVRPDGIWLRIINAHAAKWFSALSSSASQFSRAGTNRTFADERRGARHDAAQSRAGDFFSPANFLTSAAALPPNHSRVGMLICFTTRRSFARPTCVCVLPMSKSKIISSADYAIFPENKFWGICVHL